MKGYTKVVELAHGVVETRTYDSTGRLIEIQRKQPPAKVERIVSVLKRSPGLGSSF